MCKGGICLRQADNQTPGTNHSDTQSTPKGKLESVIQSFSNSESRSKSALPHHANKHRQAVKMFKSILFLHFPSDSQSLGNSQREYDKQVLLYSIRNQLRFRNNLGKSATL